MSRGLRSAGVLLAAGLAAATGAAADQSQGDPALDYALQCQGCHLPDGRGAPQAGVPRMRGFVGRFLGVEGGRAYLVQVPGVAQAPLDAAATAALMNWLLVRFSAAELPEPFVPYTAAEVARHQAAARIDVTARRAELLARIEAAGDRAGRAPQASAAGHLPPADP